MFIYWILLFFSPIQTQFLVSYNQPIFRSNSSWARTTTTTFANHSHIDLHFNPTNSIYTFNHDNGQILISTKNSKSKQILYSNLSPSTQHPYSSLSIARFLWQHSLKKRKRTNIRLTGQDDQNKSNGTNPWSLH